MILLTLIILLIVLFPLTWLGYMLGLPVKNMLSGEGIRYFFTIIPSSLCTPFLPVTMSIIICIGAMKYSDLGGRIKNMISSNKSVKHTFRQRQALLVSIIFVVFYILAMLMMIVGPGNLLLNLEGELFPSNQFYGIVLSLPLALTITAMVYGMLSYHLRGLNNVLTTLYYGINRYAIWIAITMIFSLLADILIYIYDK